MILVWVRRIVWHVWRWPIVWWRRHHAMLIEWIVWWGLWRVHRIIASSRSHRRVHLWILIAWHVVWMLLHRRMVILRWWRWVHRESRRHEWELRVWWRPSHERSNVHFHNVDVIDIPSLSSSSRLFPFISFFLLFMIRFSLPISFRFWISVFYQRWFRLVLSFLGFLLMYPLLIFLFLLRSLFFREAVLYSFFNVYLLLYLWFRFESSPTLNPLKLLRMLEWHFMTEIIIICC